MSVLLVQAGDRRECFTDRFTIGTKGCDLILADEYVSNMHAVCYPEGDGWIIEDLGSVNGTWVGGARVWSPFALAKGDRIKVGHTVMTVVPA